MRGIDISNNNGYIDFSRVKNSGIEEVYIKATEGTTYQDPYRDINYAGATGVGLPVGFYHYLVGTSAPETQAENFYNQINSKVNSLRPCLDIEVAGFNVMDFALRFISRFESLCNLPMCIYSSPYFINENLDSRLAKYPLWIAHYGVSDPMDNNVWGSSYVGHQYTSTGHVDGINGYCDLNNFYDGIYIDRSGAAPGTPPDNTQSMIEQGKNYVGDRCGELQAKLINKGYECGGYGADGIFGEATLYSLLQFQRDHGLAVDGLAGPETFAELDKPNWVCDPTIMELQNQINLQGFGVITVDGIAGEETLSHTPTISKGAQGGISKCLQVLLNRFGNNLVMDGIFGESTKNAVLDYQRKKGIGVDGVVGQNTWRKLYRI